MLAIAIAATASWTGTLARIDNATIDTRFAVRGERAVNTDVVVVGIDDKTLDEGDLRWPFRRSLHAKAVDVLTGAGARVIGYDVAFAEPTTPFDGSPQAARAAEDDDIALLDAISRSKRVVLAANEFATAPDGTVAPNILYLDEDLAAANATYGNTGWPIDSAFRRLPTAAAGVPSFPAAIAARALGRQLRPDERALVDYPKRRPPSVSFLDVVDGRLDPAAVRDKIVIVGATSQRLGDVHPTPFGGGLRPGAEINAAAVATLLDGRRLRLTPAWLTALLTIALAGVAGLAALWRPIVGVALGAVAVLAFLLAAQLAFNGGAVMPLAAPVLAGVLATVGGLAVNTATVLRDRRRLRTAFARFLPEPLVDRMVDRAEERHGIAGERRYATVVFADLRGFTAAAEKLPPEMVIELLNRYLTEVGDAVLDHGGTLVSYQGDGIMAVFGAPVEQPDHADRALAAVRDIRDARLPAFNAWAAGHGIAAPFAVGIGVASGPVMSGTVGSQRRLEYATVGDTTNAAARLQVLSKELAHSVLIADATRAALTAAAGDLLAVGALDVRGREVPASVWTLAPPKGVPK